MYPKRVTHRKYPRQRCEQYEPGGPWFAVIGSLGNKIENKSLQWSASDGKRLIENGTWIELPNNDRLEICYLKAIKKDLEQENEALRALISQKI